MDEHYNNKYRKAPARLLNWDYGAHGLYYVTICTKNRERYFGEIEKSANEIESTGTAFLNMTELGKLAFGNWAKIPVFHPYVEVDDYVIMPDHIHGILFINKPDKITWEINKFGAQSKNLASIIRGFKSSVKQYATITNIEFLWQSRFYDRVIRSQQEYENIKRYIYNNPDQWFENQGDFDNLFKP